MKIKFLLLIALLAFNQTKAQFISVTDCDNNGRDHSIFFLNADTGFVGGEANGKGIIQRTTDGGNTWTNAYTSTVNLEWVYDIYFANSDTGIAVGENGTILRTIDGGTNWSRQTILNVTSFNSVFFPTSTVGYVTGRGTTQAPIYKTIDGGMNWTPQVSNADSALGSIYFVGTDTGYAAGSYDILKTTNGGTTWIRSNNNFLSNGDIYCTDARTCYISGYSGPMIKTIDGGTTWNPLSFPTLSPPYVYATTSVYFTDAMIGYATGAKFDTTNFTGTGTIFKTTNAGQTWNNINTPANNNTLQNTFLTSINFVNSQIGYAMGGGGSVDGGKVLKTTNAGSAITCHALYSVYPDTTTPHHWLVLNEATGIGPVNYLWNWGDGSYDSIAYPGHTYANAGFYTICLSEIYRTQLTPTISYLHQPGERRF